MTHFRVDIQLPHKFNPEEGKNEGIDVPAELFHQTYEELLEMARGISTSDMPINGSWIHPDTKKRYDDKSTIFSVIVASNGGLVAKDVPKIKELIDYKEKLKERFKQEEILMVATHCAWI